MECASVKGGGEREAGFVAVAFMRLAGLSPRL